MDLDYALVTDSSLPEQVKGSSNYVSLDKDQWLDLVEYSEIMVNEQEEQSVLFLICAKGTAEQEEADRLRREAELEEEAEMHARLRDLERDKEDQLTEAEERERRREELLAELAKLNEENEGLIDAAAEKERLERERLEALSDRKRALRDRSKSIFNALYKK